jgi:hypothetical protein
LVPAPPLTPPGMRVGSFPISPKRRSVAGVVSTPAGGPDYASDYPCAEDERPRSLNLTATLPTLYWNSSP